MCVLFVSSELHVPGLQYSSNYILTASSNCIQNSPYDQSDLYQNPPGKVKQTNRVFLKLLPHQETPAEVPFSLL